MLLVGLKSFRNIYYLYKNSLQSHGAWLTFGNIDLHLIKGRPCVHSDDDLIVSHIAIAVSDMAELRRKFEKLNVASRKNLSVPNPADSETGIVEQVRINKNVRMSDYYCFIINK